MQINLLLQAAQQLLMPLACPTPLRHKPLSPMLAKTGGGSLEMNLVQQGLISVLGLTCNPMGLCSELEGGARVQEFKYVKVNSLK